MEHRGEVLRPVQTVLVIPDFCDMHPWISTGGGPRTDSVQRLTLPDDAGLPIQAQIMSCIPILIPIFYSRICSFGVSSSNPKIFFTANTLNLCTFIAFFLNESFIVVNLPP